MASIDPNIALSIRPAQIESPLVHAARAAELQGAQQNQFMNMLKMKEYVDETRNKNAMMKWLADKPDLNSEENLNQLATQYGAQGLALAKQIDDRRKAQGEALYRGAQTSDLRSQEEKRRYELGETQRTNAIKTISGFRSRQEALDMLYESEANGTIPAAAAENIRRMMPYNEEDFPAFQQKLITQLMTPDARVKDIREQEKLRQQQDDREYANYLIGREINGDTSPIVSKADFLAARNQNISGGMASEAAAAPAPASAVAPAPAPAATSTTEAGLRGTTVSAEGMLLAPGVAELIASRDPAAQELGKIIQKRFEDRIKSQQFTGDFRNVELARQKIAQLRKLPQTPEIVEDIAAINRMIAGAEKGKATTLNVGLSTEKKYGEQFAGNVAKADVDLKDAAERAPEAANTANRIIGLLQSGQVITGSAANIKLQLSKLLRLGGGSESEAITNTEVLLSSLADSTLGAIKSSGLGSGQGFTDKDREFLERAKAGQITYEATSLKRLAELAHKAAAATAGKWNKRSKTIPKSALEGTGISTENIEVPPLLKSAPRNRTPATNAKGWKLHTDADGNSAYVSPDGKQFEEVK